MAKKPVNAGIAFERDFIKLAHRAGFATEKLSTPTPPTRPCTCGAVPRSAFTTKRPYDVLLIRESVLQLRTYDDLNGRTSLPDIGVWREVPNQHAFYVCAVECKSSGTSPRLALDRIQPHQIKGLQDRRKLGWAAGLAIDLPKPASGEGEREWWWLPADAIEILFEACRAADRKSATWKELRDAGAVQIARDPASMAASLGVY